MSEGAKVVAAMMLVFGVPLIAAWELLQWALKWAWPFVRAWLHAATG